MSIHQCSFRLSRLDRIFLHFSIDTKPLKKKKNKKKKIKNRVRGKGKEKKKKRKRKRKEIQEHKCGCSFNFPGFSFTKKHIPLRYNLVSIFMLLCSLLWPEPLVILCSKADIFNFFSSSSFSFLGCWS